MKRTRDSGRLALPGAIALRGEILRFLDDTSGRRNWAHKGLDVATRHLDLDEARWKPAAGHSVWEQINHIAYWKRWILRRIQGKHPAARQAWPPAGTTAAGLRKARAALAALHRELRAAVIALDPADLHAARGARFNSAQLLLCAAAHESYHIGQIFMTRNLYRRNRRGP